MLKSGNTNKKDMLKTLWIIMESMGLFLILLSNIASILLESTVRYKVWAWLSKRRFRSILEKKGLPSDLIEILVGEYEDTVRKVGEVNSLLKSLGGMTQFTGKLRNKSWMK
ncbi:MAG: hypothetical protein GSR76_01865 [Desulfurococcales archaeon]|nr:hypothetical protein [Desulfurococcales archaeon]